MLEKHTQTKILNWLKFNGYFVWRQNSGVITRGSHIYSVGIKGQPDIIGMTKSGKFLGIEVKSSTGKLNPNQQAFKKNCISSGGIYITARSLVDVLKALNEHDPLEEALEIELTTSSTKPIKLPF